MCDIKQPMTMNGGFVMTAAASVDLTMGDSVEVGRFHHGWRVWLRRWRSTASR